MEPCTEIPHGLTCSTNGIEENTIDMRKNVCHGIVSDHHSILRSESVRRGGVSVEMTTGVHEEIRDTARRCKVTGVVLLLLE